MSELIAHPTALAGLWELESAAVGDARGRFMRLWCEATMQRIAPLAHVVQVNQSFSTERGTIRGLHFQRAPALEGKLVRCLRGRVFDVAVDLRAGSDTCLHWHGVELSEHGQRQLWIPPGFAHGFQTLSDDVEMLYLHSAAYAPQHEGGLRFDDPRLGIAWPLTPTQVSARDRSHALLGDALEWACS